MINIDLFWVKFYDDEADQDLFKELDLNNNNFIDGDELQIQN